MNMTAAQASADDVVLRDVVESDLPTFCAHQLDPEAYEMAAFTPRANDAFMAHWAKILADATLAKKTVLFKGEVAGNVLAFNQDGKRLVGYWLGRPYWGRGIASRALQAFLDGVAERPLHAYVAAHNPASLRVLQKCGFNIEETADGKPRHGSDGVEEILLALLPS
jgi:RimJ/RimL family protein N-acetyltransferase